MTALSLPAAAEGRGDLPPIPWRQMAWVTWRQHRLALSGVGALLGALAVYLVVTGVQLHHTYAVATACRPASSLACSGLLSSFNSTDGPTANQLCIFLQVVPALIGAFVGAPVIARELESGTFRFAWTQGFGRWRWSLAKLLSLAAVLAIGAGAFSVLFSWYFQPFLADGNQGPVNPNVFDLRGVTFACWTLAAFAVGALVGTLIRRVVAALAATLAVYAGLLLATVTALRAHYLPPLRTSAATLSSSAWIIGQQWQNRAGRPVSPAAISTVLQTSKLALAGKGGIPKSSSVVQYLMQHGYLQWTTYQPASRFWPFQWIEGGWLLALSVLLIFCTVALVRRRAI